MLRLQSPHDACVPDARERLHLTTEPLDNFLFLATQLHLKLRGSEACASKGWLELPDLASQQSELTGTPQLVQPRDLKARASLRTSGEGQPGRTFLNGRISFGKLPGLHGLVPVDPGGKIARSCGRDDRQLIA